MIRNISYAHIHDAVYHHKIDYHILSHKISVFNNTENISKKYLVHMSSIVFTVTEPI